MINRVSCQNQKAWSSALFQQERMQKVWNSKEILMKMSGCASVSAFQKLQKEDREAFMRQLNEEGINIAQIGRITGYSRQVVYRALNT